MDAEHPLLAPDFFRSWLARLLPLCKRTCVRAGLGHVWEILRRFYSSGTRPLRTRLHGREFWMNAGNPYPFTLRECPRFNAGLVATVTEIHATLQRPVRLIDVGAAIGDTVALLHERCSGKVADFFCVDGDSDFAHYFRRNTAGIESVRLKLAMLAASASTVRSLVRHHPGTATATGSTLTPATTLDTLLANDPLPWDLLKIDVDGYDGDVIAGSARLLSNARPAVYFEWHPRLIQNAHNRPALPFEQLNMAGYAHFLWFHNRGPFSHFTGVPTADAIANSATLLANNADGCDAHFDVLALPSRWSHLALIIAQRVGY